MITNVFEQQLDAILQEFESFRTQSNKTDLSDLPKADRQALVTKSIAAINRIAGANSPYMKEADRVLSALKELHTHTTSIVGVVKALRDDLRAGYIQSLIELVHGDTYCDYLEMAQHLCNAGYKDAAAVIAGSTLESHLRNLCHKANIPTETQKPNGPNIPKKAESLNTDLSSARIYEKLDQKSVTAWLDLRNKAAYGEYEKYTQDQVNFLISSIRNFIVRNQA